MKTLEYLERIEQIDPDYRIFKEGDYRILHNKYCRWEFTNGITEYGLFNFIVHCEAIKLHEEWKNK